MQSPAALQHQAAQLAALSGQPVACALRWQALPAQDPLALLPSLPAGERRFLRQDANNWLLIDGCCARWQSWGPERFAACARHYAALQPRCVCDSPAGAPTGPLCWLEAGFADRGSGPLWGAWAGGNHLILPARAWLMQDGQCFLQEAWAVDAGGRNVPPPAPGALPEADLPPAPEPAHFQALAEQALLLLRGGALRKVVLARRTAGPAADPRAVLQRLAGEQGPAQWLYQLDLGPERHFTGLSPELLLAQKAEHWQSLALAGSCPRAADPQQDAELAAALLAATKERKEHQLVVEHLVQQLSPLGRLAALPAQPRLRQLARVQHLATPLELQAEEADVYDALGDLHPSPAVGGLPQALASAWIQQHEGLERGLYTGVIGWRHPSRSQHIVPLRGALLGATDTQLFAGAGLVETSDPAAELAETALKMRTMQDAISG